MRGAFPCAVVLSVLAACSSGGGAPQAGGGDLDASADVSQERLSGGGDATIDAASEAPAGCGEFSGDSIYTCSKDGNSRGKCVDGGRVEEACSRGCLREKLPAYSICMGTTSNWSCTGSYGTTPVDDGDYYLTSFGCWTDSNGGVHTDPYDNCIPTCLDQARNAGLCAQGDSGPQCEEKIDWFTADGARFGCLARLRVTNPANGKSLIAVALDFGPACSGEQKVQHAVLDASGRVDQYLFGGDQGASDKALVHVVQVDDSYPLGPI